MVLSVKPASRLKGKVSLPSSKSYSVRAFLIAACGGRSLIIDPSRCDDALVAMRVARALGADVRPARPRRGQRPRQAGRKGTPQWIVRANRRPPKCFPVDVGESGTVLRFLLPLLGLYGKKARVVGKGTLRGRPNMLLTRALRAMGMNIRGQGPKESIPIRVTDGLLRGGPITIDGDLSSQFISALLIACPQLAEDTRLTLRGRRLVSGDYIVMTRQVLAQSGIKITRRDARHYRIRGGQKFKGLKKFTVPADYGLAAFLMAAAVLIRSDVTLTGSFKDELLQADSRIVPLLRKMGVTVQKTSRSIRIKGPYRLKGGNFSLQDCPDLVPVMAVLGLFAKGKTRLSGIGHARVKESDRISDLAGELRKVGAVIKEKPSEIIIEPQAAYKTNRLLNPHKDHRLAMAFCVLGLKLGARVRDIECTRKSYPDFVRDFKAMGAEIV